MLERIRKLVDDRTGMLVALGHDLRTPITRQRLRSEFVGDEELRGHMLRDLDQMRAMMRQRHAAPETIRPISQDEILTTSPAFI